MQPGDHTPNYTSLTDVTPLSCGRLILMEFARLSGEVILEARARSSLILNQINNKSAAGVNVRGFRF